MSCETLKDGIVELARGKDLGPGTAAAVETHVEHCASCAALLARERQLSEGLRALAAARATDLPTDALGRRLLEVFAEQQSRPRAAAVSRAHWLRAAAAVMLIAGAVAWWRSAGGPASNSGRPAALPQPTRQAHADPPATPATGAAIVQPPDSGRSPQVDRPPTAAHVRRAGRVIRPEGFVLLPAAAGLPDFESGEIVRLEIPAASLPSYGIEIVPEVMKDKPVEADLLVGQDGQPRAIRLVANLDLAARNTRPAR
jgi:hypothetical protein